MRNHVAIMPRVRHRKRMTSTPAKIARPIYVAPRKDGDWR